MNLFKKKRNITLEDIYTIQQSILEKIYAKPSEREKRLEEMFFNAKAHKIVEYEEQIKRLKSQNECKDVVIEQQAKIVEQQARTIKKLQAELKKRRKKNE